MNTKLGFNPIQYGVGGKKGPPINFFTVTSTNVGISTQNFLTFSFSPRPFKSGHLVRACSLLRQLKPVTLKW